MQKLIDGYLRFRAEIFPQWKDHFHLLAESQSPDVLFITCADSRIVPNLIVQSEPGDMFICRNAGNVVPPAGERVGGVSATIEYAVEVLKVAHIIICGHSDCGAVRAAMQPETRDLPSVRPWLHYVEEAQRKAETLLDPLEQVGSPSHGSPGAVPVSELRGPVCANVVGQLVHLRTQPSVAAAVAAGVLQVHGWYYDILTGAVEVYVPEQRCFLPLETLKEGSKEA